MNNKKSLQFLKGLNIELPHDPAILPLGTRENTVHECS